MENETINEFSERNVAEVYDYLFHQINNQEKDEGSNESNNNNDENLFMIFADLSN